MSHYLDAFVIPIKRSKVNAYKKLATWGCKVWMKHGALNYYECVMEEFNSKHGMGFKKMCKLKAGETAIFAFIVYKSKAHRNKVNKKVMAEMSGMGEIEMPFDMKRFAQAGCKTLVRSMK